MNWGKFFGTKNDEPRPLVRDYDQKLVQNVSRRRFPSWKQFKYIGRFLDENERRVVQAMLFLAVAVFAIWLTAFVFDHRVVVPKNGGEYIEALVGQPKLLNPIFSSANDVDADITPLLYDGLFRWGKNRRLVPNLASGYTVSDDQKTYTIKLRDDIYWTDGEKINADDVAFTFETIQNPEVNSPLLPSFQGVQVEATNEREIKFTLKEPFVSFLNSLTVGILPEHVWSGTPPSNMKLSKENLQPKATSGAWKFVKLVKDGANVQAYYLAKNDNYHGLVPYLDNVTFRFYHDYTEAADALRAKEVTAAAFLPQDLRAKIVGKNLTEFQLHLPQYTAIFFNRDQQPLLKNDDLRRALALAIDKNFLVQQTLKGEGETIDSPFPIDWLGRSPESEIIKFNQDEANKILDKTWTPISPEDYVKTRRPEILKNKIAELRQLPEFAATDTSTVTSTAEQDTDDQLKQETSSGQTFYRKDKNNAILTVNLTTADTPEYVKVAEIVARMWRSIGVQTKIQTFAIQQIGREALKDRNYEALLYGEILGDDPDPFPFWHSSQAAYPGLNLSLFADRNADKLLEEARAINDTTKRKQLYREFRKILAKDVPAIFLYAPTYGFVADAKLKGVEFEDIFTPPDRYNNLSDWYLKTKWAWK